MYVSRWATAAALCALFAAPNASAQQDAGKLPAPSAAYKSAWPTTVTPQRKVADAHTPPPASQWLAQDIELAAARCVAQLKGLDLVAMPEPAFREGSECGTPAPMKLVSIGSNPQVALSPPPVLTCDMIAALHKWVQNEVQPLARRHLGAPVIRVTTMSSYSCRNAYGRARSRLSEHGRVNALDIGSFVTTKGTTAMVVADWGPIARELAAQKKQEGGAETADNQPAPPEAAPPAALPSPSLKSLRPSLGLPGVTVQPEQPVGLGLVPMGRLGGPKTATTTPPNTTPKAAPAPLGEKAVFLRAVHKAACRIFGTVLGPEANNAHKNHFHVDMAERKHGVICE
jgi:hypothetical protein